MSDNKSRLGGKGLEAIFGDNLEDILEDIQSGSKEVEGVKVSGITNIPVEQIRPNPNQPRKEFESGPLKELAESIKTHGVFNPVTVIKSASGYDLVMGERRLRASKLAGMTEIPAYIVDYDEQQMMELALLENTQREDLNVIEEAEAYKALTERFNYTQEELAKRVSKSREHVANTLRLLKLPENIQEYVIKKQLTMGHVRALLSIENPEDMTIIAKKTIKENLSVRQVEQIVRNMKKDHNTKPAKHTNLIYKGAVRTMENKLQTQVEINEKRIAISYHGKDDLNRILELIGCLEED